MRIGPVDLDRQVLVVAEIGNNHEGDFGTAAALVSAAAETGVQAVKFQTFRTERFVSATDSARFDRLRSFELSIEQFARLERLARSLGLLFLSTPLDLESAEGLTPLVDAFKIASGDNDFYPLIERVCRTGKPLIVSSGLSDLAQVRRTKEYVQAQWQSRGIVQELAVLHCVTAYPAPPEEAHLAAIRLLSTELGGAVGYSDHTLGIEACVLAVAAGARIIEKHFTLDKTRPGFRDHQLSADPQDMAELVRRVNQAFRFTGKAEKAIQPSEESAVSLVRRSIVAAADLAAGHRIAFEDLMWIRPATGLRPGQEGLLLDRTLRHAISIGQPIRIEDVE